MRGYRLPKLYATINNTCQMGTSAQGTITFLKKVEQNVETWSKDLGEQLHQFYDYCAMSLMREKMQSGRNESVANIGKTDKKSGELSTGGTSNEDGEVSKPVFCMEYNQGTCKHDDTHEGFFAGKRTWKGHICRRCRRVGEMKHHTEKECPRQK